jgi:hypothetical protein
MGPQRHGHQCSLRAARLAVNTIGVQVDERLAELLVVEDALEDGLVVIHPSDDGAEEAVAEDQPEILRITFPYSDCL